MPDGLYDSNILVWSQTQADLLRRLASGERVNAAIDWPNLIEEVEDVGRSELASCKILLRQALTHILKARAWPNSRSAGHWRAETVGFLADAADRFSPSMRQNIEVQHLYDQALGAVRMHSDDSGELLTQPGVCPFTLDQLLAKEFASTWGAKEG